MEVTGAFYKGYICIKLILWVLDWLGGRRHTFRLEMAVGSVFSSNGEGSSKIKMTVHRGSKKTFLIFRYLIDFYMGISS